MDAYCTACIHREKNEWEGWHGTYSCDTCQCKTGNYKDKNHFSPTEGRKKFFKGMFFDNFNENKNCVSTTRVLVDEVEVCPYCGTTNFFHIQDENDPHWKTVGKMCLCDGALSEIEYYKELDALEEELRLYACKRKNELKMEYPLRYNTEAIIQAKKRISERKISNAERQLEKEDERYLPSKHYTSIMYDYLFKEMK